MKTLLLWDIDGTLLSAKGAGRAALCESLAKSFGISSDLSHIDMHGRTDRWIFRRILRHYRLEESKGNFELLEENYMRALPAQIQDKGVSLLPGVQEIIQEAAGRVDVAQGLLTGNLRRGAQIKLSPYPLWEQLRFGAFGDDSEDRNELPPHALRRATSECGCEFPPERTWVIGDTPHDITCGRQSGLRTLALATGKHSTAQLASEQPTALLESLADSKAFWEIIDAR